MSYSEQIKRIRTDLLVTQKELAEILGTTFAKLYRWENGHHESSMKQKRTLRDFCKKNKVLWEVE